MISRLLTVVNCRITHNHYLEKTVASIAHYLPKDTAAYLDHQEPIPSFPLKPNPISIDLLRKIPALQQTQADPLTKKVMQKRFNLLGEEKWREFIDGKDARYGKYCYDLGIHRAGLGEKEPGYLKGMMEAVDYIDKTIDEPTTVESYLKIHSLACAHFKNENADDFTICRGDEVGAFRTIRVGTFIFPSRVLDQEIQDQLHQLDRRLGASYLETKGDAHFALNYRPNAHPDEMKIKFVKLLDGYKRDIQLCQQTSQKLYVIARLYQHSQWLHTTTDGSGRLDIAILNKHLTQNGFHPAILQHPYMCCTNTLASWIEELQEGLFLWEKTALQVHGLLDRF